MQVGGPALFAQFVSRQCFIVSNKMQVRILVLAVVVLAVDGAKTIKGEDTLNAIVENVRANELLYQNIDVRWHEAYRQEHCAVANQKTSPQAQDLDCQSVSQGNLFFLNCEGTTVGPPLQPRQSKEHLRKGFDGKETRVLELRENYVANIVDGPAYDYHMFDPHTIPMRFRRTAVPLSTFLSGYDAIVAYPKATPSDTIAGLHPVATYGGEDRFAGLRCQKIVSTEERRPGKHGEAVSISGKRVFWLAIERNYLPVKSEAFSYYYSKHIAIEECVLDRLQEIKLGVWFPFRSTMTVLDEVELLDRKKPVVGWRREWVVNEVALNPKFGIDFFRDVKFPDGAPVYRVSVGDQKITASYVQGDKPPQVIPAASRPPRRALLWALNGVTVILLVGWFVRRRLRARGN